MTMRKTLVLRAAGTSGDNETEHALRLAGAEVERVHVNHIARDSDPFAGAGLLVLPGGLTYGDDVAAGKVLAVELTAILGERLAAFVKKGGLILGIGNGFQALVKTGLLPYGEPRPAAEREFTFAPNDSRRFETRWVRLRAPERTTSLFVEAGEALELPVACAEGKFVATTPEAIARLSAENLVGYRYVAADGGVAAYPANPGGAADGIAALSDASGRMFGMMAHPERHLFAWHHPRWTRELQEGEVDGLRIFRRAVKACR